VLPPGPRRSAAATDAPPRPSHPQATLLDGDDEVLEVPMVVHVTPDSAGKLFRSIYNPLE